MIFTVGTPNNKITLFNPNPNEIKVTLNAAKGAISGSFKSAGRLTSYNGALVQRLGAGAGYFLLSSLPVTATSPQLSGAVIFEPTP